MATIGGLTLASRILGFARDLLIAAWLGAGPLADAFFIAFRLPNLFRALFAEGAFSNAFVPVFSGCLEGSGPEAARRFAGRAASILLLLLLPMTVLAEWAMPWLVGALAPGFEESGERFSHAVTLARITFPYLVLVTLTALFASVLNSLYRFAAASAAPILLNVSLIVFLLVATPYLPSAGHALAWGILAGGVAQLALVVVASRRAGMGVSFARPRFSPEIRRLGRMMVPGVLGSGVTQINVVVGTIFASSLTGAISWLSYAHHLVHLPIALIGLAARTALLPVLSRGIHGRERSDGGGEDQRLALGVSMALGFPAAVGLVTLSELTVEVLFYRGAFGLGDLFATADALTAYAVGLPTMIAVLVLVPSFFARYDTSTPVKVAAGAMVVNVALVPVFMAYWGHAGIALAQSVSSFVQAGALMILMVRRGYLNLDRAMVEKGISIVLASVPLLLLGPAAIPFVRFLSPLGNAAPVAALFGLVTLGVVMYALLALVLHVFTVQDLVRLFRRRQATLP